MEAGGYCFAVADEAAAIEQICEIVRSHGYRSALFDARLSLDSMILRKRLETLGCGVTQIGEPEAYRSKCFEADIGVTGVNWLIAETGTLVLQTSNRSPRAISLLPAMHIAIGHISQIVPDLFDVFEGQKNLAIGNLPSCVTLITGPSKTGDIELRLVTGVHGPGNVQLIMMMA
jgi:L-lactate dehydrogenase complex protein LldG